MNEHFIKEIKIKNFKCFKDFKAEGFGRVNLISGRNNVGKTALMEACYVNVYSQTLKTFVMALQDIKYMRENLNILANRNLFSAKIFIERSNGINVVSNINNSSFKIDERDGMKLYDFQFNKQHINVNINDFSYELQSVDNINFIDSFGLSNSNIISNFSAIQKQDKESFLNTILKDFDQNIDAFKIIDDLPQCKVSNQWLEITEFGDGVRHIVSIVSSLFKSANGYIFIDELENGIHYTQLDKLWEIILTVSKEQNVQVFATTHSKECIESYARVAKKLVDEDVKYIKLSKLKDGSIYAGVRDYDMLQYAIDDEHEVR